MIPDGWSFRELGSVCSKVTSGGTPSRKRPEYYGGEIAWVKTKELPDGYIEDTEEHLTQEGLASSSAKLLPPETILMAMYGATVGKLGILTRSMACNQAACALIPNPKLVNYRFLFYRLVQDRNRITSLATGAAQQNLNAGMIKSASSLFPPLGEQNQIAELLGAFDDLIQTNRRIAADILELTRAVYAQVSARAEASVTLGSVAQANPEKRRPGAPEGSLNYLDIGSMTDGFIGDPSQMTWRDAPSRARRGASRGDVLWATVRPNRRAHGLLARDIDDLVVSTGIAVLRPTSQPMSLVFSHTDSQRFVDLLVGRVDGSAYPAVKSADFLAVDIPDILGRDVEVFRRSIDPLWYAIGHLEKESQSIARQRDELLPLLMSGKVRVRDLKGRPEL